MTTVISGREDQEILGALIPLYRERKLLYRDLGWPFKNIFSIWCIKENNHKCRICGERIIPRCEGKHRGRWVVGYNLGYVDHHHGSDIVRDCLCLSCNSRVGTELYWREHGLHIYQ